MLSSALGAAVLIGLILVVKSHNREPVYKGKTFDQWFKLSQTAPLENAPPRKVIIDMGPAAVPLLAEKLRYQEGFFQNTWRVLWQKSPAFLRRYSWMRPPAPDIVPRTAAELLFQIGDDSRAAGKDLMAVYERRFILRYKLPASAKINWTEQITNPPALMTAGRMSFGPLSDVSFTGMKCLTAFCTNSEIIPMMLAAAHENRVTFGRGCPVWYNPGNNTNLSQAIEQNEPLLLSSLNNPDYSVRYLSMLMLSSLLPEHAELRPVFLEGTESPDASVRMAALGALAKIHLDFETALPVMGRLCTDTNAAVSNAASTMVFPSLGFSRKIFPALSNSLSSTNASMRLGAAQLLRLYPPRAKMASAKLEELTDPAREPDEQVRAAAAETLKIISQENERQRNM
jgi:hypothetical protein